MSKSRNSENSRAKVLFSACLLGNPCRYDGASKGHPEVEAIRDDLQKKGIACIGVCPEELGQLGTPRPAAHLTGGAGKEVLDGLAKVITVEDGQDVSRQFIHGAECALSIGGSDVKLAILKARSPSCGIGQTRIDGTLEKGDGVFAALLRESNIPLYHEETTDLSLQISRELKKT